MESPGTGCFRKEERLCGKTRVAALVADGKWGGTRHMKYCWVPGGGELTRILVSVPKKNFKRAVKRNLLKRRIREAYRLQKAVLGPARADIMFVYTSPEVADFSVIAAETADILSAVAAKCARNDE